MLSATYVRIALPRGMGIRGWQDPDQCAGPQILGDQEGGEQTGHMDARGGMADQLADLDETFQERIQFVGREHRVLRHRGKE